MPPAPSSRSISASEFKARCLELMDEVNTSRSELVITKHGAAVARLVPVSEAPASALGFLRGTVRSEPSLLDSEVSVASGVPSVRGPSGGIRGGPPVDPKVIRRPDKSTPKSRTTSSRPAPLRTGATRNK